MDTEQHGYRRWKVYLSIITTSGAWQSRVRSEVRGQAGVIRCCHSFGLFCNYLNELWSCRCDKPWRGESIVGTERERCSSMASWESSRESETDSDGLWEGLRNRTALSAFPSVCGCLLQAATTWITLQKNYISPSIFVVYFWSTFRITSKHNYLQSNISVCYRELF